MKQRKWLITISVFLAMAVLTVIGLSTAYAVREQQHNNEKTALNNKLENIYLRQYYELIDNVGKARVAMSKALVSGSASSTQNLLDETSKYADASAMCLEGLSHEDSTSEATMKYMNQLGDYCGYICEKIYESGITDEEYKQLEKLYELLVSVSTELANVHLDLANNGGSIIESMREGGIFNTTISNLESDTVTYPSMIYDGPFSDSLETTTAKGLKGEDLSQEQAQEKLDPILAGLNPTNVEYIGSGTVNFESYQFVCDTDKGKAYIELSKKGGMPIAMSIPYTVTEPAYDTDKCIEKADLYVKSLGFNDMKAVWVSNYNSVAFINYAYVVDDCIVYSDLVKVKVSTDDLSIVGLECLNYLYNHQERVIEEPAISEEDAVGNISKRITVEEVQLALIPRNNSKELLAYEVYGVTADGTKCFIYVDAKTGNEVSIMLVIDSELGEQVV